MKKTLLALLFFIPFVCSANLWADRAGYTITAYKFNGTYHSNNTVTVNELIEVNFDEPRHGIYHSIPEFFYMNVSQDPDHKNVKKYSTEIQDYSVSGAKYTTEHTDDNFVFKVGDANKEITGFKTYEFNYTYVIPDDRYDDADFIFYSVLGSEWSTTIDRFDFNLTFENGIPDDLRVYSGAYGNEEDALNVSASISGNTIKGYASNIPPNNAITLYGVVPEGYFTNEKKAVSNTLVWLLFAAAFAITVYGLYKTFTAEPKTPVQTVEFYPPEGITSGEVGKIIDNSSDTIDLISMIPWFADKGYLEIHEEKKLLKTEIILKKINDLPQNAPLYQKTLFDGLFKKGDTVNMNDLPKEFAETVSKTKKHLDKEFEGDKKLFVSSFDGVWYGLLSSVLVAIALINDTPVTYFDNFLGVLVPAVALIMAFIKSKSTFLRFINRKKFIILTIISAVVSFLAIYMYWEESFFAISEYILPWWTSTLLLILNAVVNIFGYRNVVQTDWCVEVTGKLMGLKEFIKTAEMPRLKALVDENPSYFYNVLPYAMVFGLTEKWGKMFKNLDVKQPDWYHTSSGRMFNAMYFSHSIQNGITSTITSSMAKTTASNITSGGFSGGGGGGGGGGSW